MGSIYKQQKLLNQTFSVQCENSLPRKIMKKKTFIFLAKFFVLYNCDNNSCHQLIMGIFSVYLNYIITYKILCSIIFLLIYRFSECEITKVIQSRDFNERDQFIFAYNLQGAGGRLPRQIFADQIIL